MKTSPTTRAWQQRSNFAVILVVLALAALLAPRCGPSHARVTISGLDLGVSQQEIESRFGPPSFQLGTPPHRQEYWAFKTPALERDLLVALSQDGRAHQLQGGDPQIDGQSVKAWSPDQVMSALGTPSKVASSKSLCPKHSAQCDRDCSYSKYTTVVLGRNTSQASLSYPDLNLIVNWSSQNGTEFVLFARPDQLD